MPLFSSISLLLAVSPAAIYSVPREKLLFQEKISLFLHSINVFNCRALNCPQRYERFRALRPRIIDSSFCQYRYPRSHSYFRMHRLRRQYHTSQIVGFCGCRALLFHIRLLQLIEVLSIVPYLSEH